MVNVIPRKAQQELRIRYYTRLFGTFFLVSAAVFVLGAGLLIPSYFLAHEEAITTAQYARALEQRLALGGSSSSGHMLSALEEQVSILKTYEHDALATESVAAIVASLSEGVIIQNINVTLSDTPGYAVKLSGIADTRAHLVEFVAALQGKTVFKNVSVPVSDLAAETDLRFSLSFALNINQP